MQWADAACSYLKERGNLAAEITDEVDARNPGIFVDQK